MFQNLTPVVKNLVILNVIFFLATVVLRSKGIDLGRMLGSYYPVSGEFKPYQIVTHMFMHGSFMHILFNMFGLIIFGPNLERVWGAKKFLTFYFTCGLGALAIYYGANFFQYRAFLNDYGVDYQTFLDIAEASKIATSDIDAANIYFSKIIETSNIEPGIAFEIFNNLRRPIVGASGAIYGVLLGFGMLFPNTQLMLLFPPIPIKAKYLVIILGVIALYSGIKNNPADSTAHFAHLGGMIFGFILIKLWKSDRNSFY